MRTLHTVSIVSTRIYIPTNRAQVFPFLLTLTNTCYFLLNNNHFDMWDDTSLWFLFAFTSWFVILRSFYASIDHLCVFLRKMSIQIFCLFFNQVAWVCYFLMLSFMSTLHISYINPYWMYHLQTSSPILLIVSLSVQKLFSLI